MDVTQALRRIPVDEQSVLKRFSGNRVLMERFVREFPDDPTYAALCSALERGDCAAGFAAAHTLKGIAANLGFEELYHCAASLTELLREERLAEARADFASLQKSYHWILSCLSS